MNPAQFLSILRARWLMALSVLILTTLGGLGASLLFPKKYTATASVVIDFKPDPVSATLYAGMLPTALLATQVDIIQSDRIALRVVKNLNLAENPEVRAKWMEETGGAGSLEQWLSASFQPNLDVKPSRESSVLTIAYTAADPRFAAGLANAFTRAYVETALELRVDPARQYSSFFETQLKDARETLEKAQAKLSSFQKENGLIATDERFDVENQRLNELSSQLVGLQGLSAESTSRSAIARGSSGTQIQEVLNNPLVAGLKADVARGEARLQELGSRLGENHPQVREAKASVDSLKSKLEAESRRVAGSVGLNAAVNGQRVAQVQAAFAAQRAKVLRMKAVRDEASVLIRDTENAQRAFDAIQQRLNQTSLESQTTQSNVTVLSQAVPPLTPSSPKIALNTLLATFVGTVLAVALALLLELRDRRIRTVDDILISLDLPVLGYLPRPGNSKGKAGLSAMQRRLIAPLPAATRGI